MLPPLGPMVLGSGTGQTAAPSAGEQPTLGQFADSLLAHTQATGSSFSNLRDLDHNLAEAEITAPKLDHLPGILEQASNEDTAPLEHFVLNPVGPLVDHNAKLPVALPPGGNGLPVVSEAMMVQAQAAVQASNRLGASALHPEFAPRLVEGAVAGSELAVQPAVARGPDGLGPGMQGFDTARAVQENSLLVNPGADVLKPRSNDIAPAPSNGAPGSGASSILTPTQPPAADLTLSSPTDSNRQNALNPFSVSINELISSALAGRTSTPVAPVGKPELPLLPTPSLGVDQGITAGTSAPKLSADVAQLVGSNPKPGNPALVGSLVGASVAPNPASNVAANTGTPTELPNVSSQLVVSSAASLLADRVNQSVRGAGNQSGSMARGDGLLMPAGNQIEVANTGVTAATISTQLRAAMASMDARQVATTAENATLGASVISAVSAESQEVTNSLTSTTSTTAAPRTTNPAVTLPSGLAPATANSRLDVGEGTGGQWVGRLSQMIAQQQLTGQSLRIALSPAELGSVELTFSGSADNWSVALGAQQGQTRELLESHIDRIRTMLQDLGLRDVQVAMAGRWTGGEASAGQQNSGEPQPGAEQAGGWQHTPSVQGASAEAEPSSPISQHRSSVSSSGVDAYV